MISTPASSQRRIWSIVALASDVSVFVMVCTEIGASPPTSTWTLTEEGILQASSLGESAIAWERLPEVWRFPDLWLLIWGRDVYSTIPVAQMPREARQMIERRVRETGGVLR